MTTKARWEVAESTRTGRTFPTGATRDQDDTKPDYRGFLCPLVQRRFGEYMLEHQRRPDGSKRASDNWKKGIPSKAYLESLGRHVQELTEQFEFQRPTNEPPHTSADWSADDVKRYEDTLAAIYFNVQGLLRNSLIGRGYQNRLNIAPMREPSPTEKTFREYIGQSPLSPQPHGSWLVGWDWGLGYGPEPAPAPTAPWVPPPTAAILEPLPGVDDERSEPEDVVELDLDDLLVMLLTVS